MDTHQSFKVLLHVVNEREIFSVCASAFYQKNVATLEIDWQIV